MPGRQHPTSSLGKTARRSTAEPYSGGSGMDNWNVNVGFNATDHSFSFQGNCTPDGFMYALSGVKSSYLVTLGTITSSQLAQLTLIPLQEAPPVTVHVKS